MLKRYRALITDQGLDAAIPLMNDPSILKLAKASAEVEYRKELAEIYSEFARQIFNEVFENNKTIYISDDYIKGADFSGGIYNPDPNSLNGRIESAKQKVTNKVIDAGKADGAVDPREYEMFNLRKRFAGEILLEPMFAMDEKDFEKIRSGMSPWHSAFHILDGMINGKTDLGRFFSKGREIAVLDKMESSDVKKLKKLRRVFFDKINRTGEDDPDEI